MRDIISVYKEIIVEVVMVKIIRYHIIQIFSRALEVVLVKVMQHRIIRIFNRILSIIKTVVKTGTLMLFVLFVRALICLNVV